MRLKQILFALLAGAVLAAALGGCGAPERIDPNAPIRYQHRFRVDVPAGGMAVMRPALTLEAGDTITINATYTPMALDMDFGVIAPDGLFYSVHRTENGIHYAFEVEEAGAYTVAIRNPTSTLVDVFGLVYG